jgi:hypothetical protein
MVRATLFCPHCGQPVERVYCVWESVQTWVVRRNGEGNIVNAREKWYGGDELKSVHFQCGCELPKEEWSSLLERLEALDS